MEVKYIIVQTNLNTNLELGVQLDVTGSIYMVDVDKSFRFSTVDITGDVKTSLEKANNALDKHYTYKIVKETREEYTDGTINE
ncbi:MULTISPECIES: hypothetical protein [Staphylococcus]|uniref:Phage protein n=1 Tax=Staphylococcus agnetis TaxID=985762 RepID=A0AAW9YXK7_9STAP|nr:MULTISPECIES: hypothetical protein [Staphylococcus]NHM92486.1 hypothetical protein [Staphylococcus sp. 10602379]NJI03264.1 hypothetical protein [Staphylococcus agnetis]